MTGREQDAKAVAIFEQLKAAGLPVLAWQCEAGLIQMQFEPDGSDESDCIHAGALNASAEGFQDAYKRFFA